MGHSAKRQRTDDPISLNFFQWTVVYFSRGLGCLPVILESLYTPMFLYLDLFAAMDPTRLTDAGLPERREWWNRLQRLALPKIEMLFPSPTSNYHYFSQWFRCRGICDIRNDDDMLSPQCDGNPTSWNLDTRYYEADPTYWNLYCESCLSRKTRAGPGSLERRDRMLRQLTMSSAFRFIWTGRRWGIHGAGLATDPNLDGGLIIKRNETSGRLGCLMVADIHTEICDFLPLCLVLGHPKILVKAPCLL